MTRVLVLGIGPLAIDDPTKFHAGGNRAWHLTRALMDEGHEVTLVCMRITDNSQKGLPKEERRKLDGLTCIHCDEVTCFANDNYLRDIIREYQPQAIVGACDYPSARAVAVADSIPVWADIHGYPLGEAQAKAYHYEEPGYIHHFWNIHRPALFRADRFSVTSERQRFALIGELGTMGRMNHMTFGEELVQQIPIGWDESTAYHIPEREKESPFTVYFCGGFNLWCDVETLFNGLEAAMEQDERIRFRSTGGAIDGHDEKTYPRFQALVEQSPMRDRFDLRGWVSRDIVDQSFRECHLGINVDLPCYETLIGARNRITEFLARGLPTLSTLGTEISQILFYKSIILSVPMQSPETLAGEILLAANHPTQMQKKAREGRTLFEQQYTYSITARPLLDWVKAPERSGDGAMDPVRLDYRRPGESPEPVPFRQRFLKMFR